MNPSQISGLNVSAKQFTPKYLDLARDLVERIAEESMAVGDRLGTELEFAEQYQVSRVTVRQALKLLEDEGYINRKKAVGTFVAQEGSQLFKNPFGQGTVVIVCSSEDIANHRNDLMFSTFLRSAERMLALNKYAIQVVSVGDDAEMDRQRIKALVDLPNLSAFCTMGPALDSYIDLIPDIPLVTTCYCPAENQHPWVGNDREAPAQSAIEYLLKKGHRNIGVICGPSNDRSVFTSFVTGYRNAFKGAGLIPNRNLLYYGCPGESVEELAGDLFHHPLKPTAVFVSSWRDCRGLLTYMEKEGLKVPDDWSLISYGSHIGYLNYKVQIARLEPDYYKIAKEACSLIFSLCKGEKMQERLEIPCKLVEGGSVKKLGD